jgi:DNA polymerase III epsilon subunit-like protein
MDDRYGKTSSVCTMRASTGVCKIPKANGRGYKFPKLAEAMRHFGLEHVGAHTALGDAQACLDLFLKLRSLGVDLTPTQPSDKPNTEGRPAAPDAPRDQLQALREGRPAVTD